MYKIIGADGKEYGPVSFEQLREWKSQGRIGPQTRILPLDTNEWKTAAEIPGLMDLFPPPTSGGATPGGISALRPIEPQKGLAVTSLVLGLLSLVCLGPVTGIPAIICGHMAHSRARRSPAEYGGAGFALAGLILGYVATILSLLILPAMLLPALSKAKSKAQSINCINNMKQIGLAFKIWEIDHEDSFPFHVSTNQGGTLELAMPIENAPDPNAYQHLRILANELSTTRILVCPEDSGKTPAISFELLGPANLSYQIYTHSSVNSTNIEEVLARCPVHNHTLKVDGSVESGDQRSRRFTD